MLQGENAAAGFGVTDAHTRPARTRILVIEDDPHMQKVLQRTFREPGSGNSIAKHHTGHTGSPSDAASADRFGGNCDCIDSAVAAVVDWSLLKDVSTKAEESHHAGDE